MIDNTSPLSLESWTFLHYTYLVLVKCSAFFKACQETWCWISENNSKTFYIHVDHFWKKENISIHLYKLINLYSSDTEGQINLITSVEKMTVLFYICITEFKWSASWISIWTNLSSYTDRLRKNCSHIKGICWVEFNVCLCAYKLVFISWHNSQLLVIVWLL